MPFAGCGLRVVINNRYPTLVLYLDIPKASVNSSFNEIFWYLFCDGTPGGQGLVYNLKYLSVLLSYKLEKLLRITPEELKGIIDDAIVLDALAGHTGLSEYATY